MPSKSFSRTASRRSSPVRRGLLTLVLLVAAAGAASPQSLGISIGAPRGGTVDARLVFQTNQTAALIRSLDAGLESRITFTVRLYETRRGWLPFRGDRLVAQKTYARSAYRDRLDETYVVEQDDGTRRTYATEAELFAGFFTVDAATLSPPPVTAGRTLYVVARAEFEPVRLMPPLTLVSLVGATASVVTPWVRTDLP